MVLNPFESFCVDISEHFSNITIKPGIVNWGKKKAPGVFGEKKAPPLVSYENMVGLFFGENELHRAFLPFKPKIGFLMDFMLKM